MRQLSGLVLASKAAAVNAEDINTTSERQRSVIRAYAEFLRSQRRHGRDDTFVRTAFHIEEECGANWEVMSVTPFIPGVLS